MVIPMAQGRKLVGECKPGERVRLITTNTDCTVQDTGGKLSEVTADNGIRMMIAPGTPCIPLHFQRVSA